MWWDSNLAGIIFHIMNPFSSDETLIHSNTLLKQHILIANSPILSLPMVVGPNDILSPDKLKNGGRGGEFYRVLSLKKQFMLVAPIYMTKTIVLQMITSWIEFINVVSLQ
jgi:hypothetical protein